MSADRDSMEGGRQQWNDVEGGDIIFMQPLYSTAPIILASNGNGLEFSFETLFPCGDWIDMENYSEIAVATSFEIESIDILNSNHHQIHEQSKARRRKQQLQPRMYSENDENSSTRKNENVNLRVPLYLQDPEDADPVLRKRILKARESHAFRERRKRQLMEMKAMRAKLLKMLSNNKAGKVRTNGKRGRT